MKPRSEAPGPGGFPAQFYKESLIYICTKSLQMFILNIMKLIIKESDSLHPDTVTSDSY